MGKLKRLVKKTIIILINCILPIISKMRFKEDIENAKKKISNLEKTSKIYNEESLKRNLRLDSDIDLSIIIPIYNAEKTLEKCLNTIVHQRTKYQFEIIVINDGSIDNSRQILKDYKAKYENIVVIEQENGGAGKARNTGINYARRKIYRIY